MASGKEAPKSCIMDGTLTLYVFFGKSLSLLGLSFLTSKMSMGTSFWMSRGLVS